MPLKLLLTPVYSSSSTFCTLLWLHYIWQMSAWWWIDLELHTECRDRTPMLRGTPSYHTESSSYNLWTLSCLGHNFSTVIRPRAEIFINKKQVWKYFIVEGLQLGEEFMYTNVHNSTLLFKMSHKISFSQHFPNFQNRFSFVFNF